ncbi:MAG: hypothetical protein U0263_30200 [Polyangiaceae bacterium]
MARIVVGFDSTASEALVAAAARLAQALGSEVVGVFVEAPAALHLAELPFAVLVEHSGRVQSLDAERVQRLWRVAATRAESELSRAAERENVRVSFRVRRGQFLGELEAVAEERDVIVIDAGRALPRRHRAHGSVAVASERPESILPLLDLAHLHREALALVPTSRRAAEAWSHARAAAPHRRSDRFHAGQRGSARRRCPSGAGSCGPDGRLGRHLQTLRQKSSARWRRALSPLFLANSRGEACSDPRKSRLGS